MDRRLLDKYHNILIEEKRGLMHNLKRFTDDNHLSQKESTGELSSYDNHPADTASATFSRELDEGLKDSTILQLKEVENALQNIENGSYGECKVCGEDISEERLEALPAASLCEDCKLGEEEKMKGMEIRPIEQDYLTPPYMGIRKMMV